MKQKVRKRWSIFQKTRFKTKEKLKLMHRKLPKNILFNVKPYLESKNPMRRSHSGVVLFRKIEKIGELSACKCQWMKKLSMKKNWLLFQKSSVFRNASMKIISQILETLMSLPGSYYAAILFVTHIEIPVFWNFERKAILVWVLNMGAVIS